MSKQTLGIVGVAVLVVLVGAYLFFTNNRTDSLTTDEVKQVLLYVEDGDVSYKTPESGAFVKATTSPVVIADGTLVYTGLGHASILFPNNSNISLDKYTELIVHYKGDAISIFQTLGTTYHRVEALVTGASYEVETPGTLAAVRGTKFAVKYDNKTKLTKVAVTEHKVFVAHTKEGQGTTTKDILENTTVNEGDTASLKSGDKPIDIKKTETDTDMKLWIEANKGKDALEVNLKDENKSKEEIRTEVIKSFTDEKKDTTRVETKETTTDTPKKTETPETKKDPVVETKPKPVVPPLDKRITSEEVFFDTFNAKFFDYLYLDDNDTPCTSRLSATEKVKELSTYATESGYPFSSVTLVDFAQSVDAYCKNKDASVKLKLQARFDVEFPYQENI